MAVGRRRAAVRWTAERFPLWAKVPTRYTPGAKLRCELRPKVLAAGESNGALSSMSGTASTWLPRLAFVESGSGDAKRLIACRACEVLFGERHKRACGGERRALRRWIKAKVLRSGWSSGAAA